MQAKVLRAVTKSLELATTRGDPTDQLTNISAWLHREFLDVTELFNYVCVVRLPPILSARTNCLGATTVWVQRWEQ